MKYECKRNTNNKYAVPIGVIAILIEKLRVDSAENKDNALAHLQGGQEEISH